MLSVTVSFFEDVGVSNSVAELSKFPFLR